MAHSQLRQLNQFARRDLDHRSPELHPNLHSFREPFFEQRETLKLARHLRAPKLQPQERLPLEREQNSLKAPWLKESAPKRKQR